jgi:hypothetical protein
MDRFWLRVAAAIAAGGGILIGLFGLPGATSSPCLTADRAERLLCLGQTSGGVGLGLRLAVILVGLLVAAVLLAISAGTPPGTLPGSRSEEQSEEREQARG